MLILLLVGGGVSAIFSPLLPNFVDQRRICSSFLFLLPVFQMHSLFHALGKCRVCTSSLLYLFANEFGDRFVCYLVTEHSSAV